MRKAFTLMELLIAIAVLGMLAAAAGVTLTGLLSRGQAGARTQELQTIQQAMDALMARYRCITVDSNLNASITPDTAANTWSFNCKPADGSTVAVDLYEFLRKDPQFHRDLPYCWNNIGTVGRYNGTGCVTPEGDTISDV